MQLNKVLSEQVVYDEIALLNTRLQSDCQVIFIIHYYFMYNLLYSIIMQVPILSWLSVELHPGYELFLFFFMLIMILISLYDVVCTHSNLLSVVFSYEYNNVPVFV